MKPNEHRSWTSRDGQLYVCSRAWTLAFLCGCGVLPLSGCLGPPYVHGNSWQRSQIEYASAPAVEEQEVQHWAVSEGQQNRAEAMLTDAPYVALTREQANALVGESLPTVQGASPYLVRAVYCWLDPGYFEVFINDNGQLYVSHTAMGTATVWRVKRYALVVQLPREPTQVIPWCWAAV